MFDWMFRFRLLEEDGGDLFWSLGVKRIYIYPVETRVGC